VNIIFHRIYRKASRNSSSRNSFLQQLNLLILLAFSATVAGVAAVAAIWELLSYPHHEIIHFSWGVKIEKLFFIY
jgi:hypothetical protein